MNFLLEPLASRLGGVLFLLIVVAGVIFFIVIIPSGLR